MQKLASNDANSGPQLPGVAGLDETMIYEKSKIYINITYYITAVALELEARNSIDKFTSEFHVVLLKDWSQFLGQSPVHHSVTMQMHDGTIMDIATCSLHTSQELIFEFWWWEKTCQGCLMMSAGVWRSLSPPSADVTKARAPSDRHAGETRMNIRIMVNQNIKKAQKTQNTQT